MTESRTPDNESGAPTRMMVGRLRQSGAGIRSKPRRSAIPRPSRNPPPRTMTDASAAPSTPSGGNGPTPVISRGSSTIETQTEPASIPKGERRRADQPPDPDAVDQIEREMARHHRDGGRGEAQHGAPQWPDRQQAGSAIGRSVLPARAHHRCLSRGGR